MLVHTKRNGKTKENLLLTFTSRVVVVVIVLGILLYCCCFNFIDLRHLLKQQENLLPVKKKKEKEPQKQTLYTSTIREYYL